MRYALPCIACGRELRNVDDDVEVNQPNNGTAFTSHGHYGSTAYDPMDGHYIEVNVCDLCLVLHYERVREGRDRKPIMEDGSVVGFEDVRWKLVPWRPTKKALGWVMQQMLEHDKDLSYLQDDEKEEVG